MNIVRWLTSRPIEDARVGRYNATSVMMVPLFRHAGFLILNTVLISAGGVLFWWVAARYGTPSSVGLAAAMLSSMTLLITIGNLGLGFGLVRFIPSQGDGGRALIGSVTALTIVATLVATSAFVLGVRIWAPALSLLQSSPVFAAMFMGATTLAAASTLQDSTFLGKRATQLIVVKNTVFNVVRLMSIPFLAATGAVGIFGSMAAGFVVSFPVAYLVLLPWKLGLRPGFSVDRALVRCVLPFSLSNLIADLVLVAPSVSLPLVILHGLGAAATGFFYVAWLANGLLMIIPGAFAQALLAEGSHREEDLRAHLLQAARGVVVFTGVAIVAAIVVAPWGLALFGRAYATEGTALLRFFAVAVLPASGTALAFAVLRVRRMMRVVIGGQACLAAAALLLAWRLSHTEGLAGVGVAWLVANVVCALLVTPLALREVRPRFSMHPTEGPR